MAYFNGVQYAENAVVTAVPGRRARDCDIVIRYTPSGAAAQSNLILRVNNTTRLQTSTGMRLGCSGFYPGDTVNAAFSAAQTRSVPPQARAYSITRLSAASGGQLGVTIDM